MATILRNDEPRPKKKAQGKFPFTGLPQGAPPRWATIPLDAKLPMVPGAKEQVVFCTTKLCDKIRQTNTQLEFDLTDPHSFVLSNEYHPLHDPHLKALLMSSEMRRRLHRGGFITKDGQVLCTLKEFNEFRRYLRRHFLAMEKQKKQTRTSKRMKGRREMIDPLTLTEKNDDKIWEVKETLKHQYEDDRARIQKILDTDHEDDREGQEFDQRESGTVRWASQCQLSPVKEYISPSTNTDSQESRFRLNDLDTKVNDQRSAKIQRRKAQQLRTQQLLEQWEQRKKYQEEYVAEMERKREEEDRMKWERIRQREMVTEKLYQKQKRELSQAISRQRQLKETFDMQCLKKLQCRISRRNEARACLRRVRTKPSMSGTKDRLRSSWDMTGILKSSMEDVRFSPHGSLGMTTKDIEIYLEEARKGVQKDRELTRFRPSPNQTTIPVYTCMQSQSNAEEPSKEDENEDKEEYRLMVVDSGGEITHDECIDIHQTPQSDEDRAAMMNELKEEHSMLSVAEMHDIQQCQGDDSSATAEVVGEFLSAINVFLASEVLGPAITKSLAAMQDKSLVQTDTKVNDDARKAVSQEAQTSNKADKLTASESDCNKAVRFGEIVETIHPEYVDDVTYSPETEDGLSSRDSESIDPLEEEQIAECINKRLSLAVKDSVHQLKQRRASENVELLLLNQDDSLSQMLYDALSRVGQMSESERARLKGAILSVLRTPSESSLQFSMSITPVSPYSEERESPVSPRNDVASTFAKYVVNETIEEGLRISGLQSPEAKTLESVSDLPGLKIVTAKAPEQPSTSKRSPEMKNNDSRSPRTDRNEERLQLTRDSATPSPKLYKEDSGFIEKDGTETSMPTCKVKPLEPVRDSRLQFSPARSPQARKEDSRSGTKIKKSSETTATKERKSTPDSKPPSLRQSRKLQTKGNTSPAKDATENTVDGNLKTQKQVSTTQQGITTRPSKKQNTKAKQEEVERKPNKQSENRTGLEPSAQPDPEELSAEKGNTSKLIEKQEAAAKSSKQSETATKSSEQQDATKPGKQQEVAKKSSEQQEDVTKCSEQPVVAPKPSKEQGATIKLSEQQEAAIKPSEQQDYETKPEEQQDATKKPSEQVATKSTEEQSTAAKSNEQQEAKKKSSPESRSKENASVFAQHVVQDAIYGGVLVARAETEGEMLDLSKVLVERAIGLAVEGLIGLAEEVVNDINIDAASAISGDEPLASSSVRSPAMKSSSESVRRSLTLKEIGLLPNGKSSARAVLSSHENEVTEARIDSPASSVKNTTLKKSVSEKDLLLDINSPTRSVTSLAVPQGTGIDPDPDCNSLLLQGPRTPASPRSVDSDAVSNDPAYDNVFPENNIIVEYPSKLGVCNEARSKPLSANEVQNTQSTGKSPCSNTVRSFSGTSRGPSVKQYDKGSSPFSLAGASASLTETTQDARPASQRLSVSSPAMPEITVSVPASESSLLHRRNVANKCVPSRSRSTVLENEEIGYVASGVSVPSGGIASRRGSGSLPGDTSVGNVASGISVPSGGIVSRRDSGSPGGDYVEEAVSGISVPSGGKVSTRGSGSLGGDIVEDIASGISIPSGGIISRRGSGSQGGDFVEGIASGISIPSGGLISRRGSGSLGGDFVEGIASRISAPCGGIASGISVPSGGILSRRGSGSLGSYFVEGIASGISIPSGGRVSRGSGSVGGDIIVDKASSGMSVASGGISSRHGSFITGETVSGIGVPSEGMISTERTYSLTGDIITDEVASGISVPSGGIVSRKGSGSIGGDITVGKIPSGISVPSGGIASRRDSDFIMDKTVSGISVPSGGIVSTRGSSSLGGDFVEGIASGISVPSGGLWSTRGSGSLGRDNVDEAASGISVPSGGIVSQRGSSSLVGDIIVEEATSRISVPSGGIASTRGSDIIDKIPSEIDILCGGVVSTKCSGSLPGEIIIDDVGSGISVPSGGIRSTRASGSLRGNFVYEIASGISLPSGGVRSSRGSLSLRGDVEDEVASGISVPSGGMISTRDCGSLTDDTIVDEVGICAPSTGIASISGRNFIVGETSSGFRVPSGGKVSKRGSSSLKSDVVMDEVASGISVPSGGLRSTRGSSSLEGYCMNEALSGISVPSGGIVSKRGSGSIGGAIILDKVSSGVSVPSGGIASRRDSDFTMDKTASGISIPSGGIISTRGSGSMGGNFVEGNTSGVSIPSGGLWSTKGSGSLRCVYVDETASGISVPSGGVVSRRGSGSIGRDIIFGEASSGISVPSGGIASREGNDFITDETKSGICVPSEGMISTGSYCDCMDQVTFGISVPSGGLLSTRGSGSLGGYHVEEVSSGISVPSGGIVSRRDSASIGGDYLYRVESGTTIGSGSLGGYYVNEGTSRVSVPSGELLSHRGSGSLGGKAASGISVPSGGLRSTRASSSLGGDYVGKVTSGISVPSGGLRSTRASGSLGGDYVGKVTSGISVPSGGLRSTRASGSLGGDYVDEVASGISVASGGLRSTRASGSLGGDYGDEVASGISIASGGLRSTRASGSLGGDYVDKVASGISVPSGGLRSTRASASLGGDFVDNVASGISVASGGLRSTRASCSLGGDYVDKVASGFSVPSGGVWSTTGSGSLQSEIFIEEIVSGMNVPSGRIASTKGSVAGQVGRTRSECSQDSVDVVRAALQKALESQSEATASNAPIEQASVVSSIPEFITGVLARVSKSSSACDLPSGDATQSVSAALKAVVKNMKTECQSSSLSLLIKEILSSAGHEVANEANNLSSTTSVFVNEVLCQMASEVRRSGQGNLSKISSSAFFDELIKGTLNKCIHEVQRGILQPAELFELARLMLTSHETLEVMSKGSGSPQPSAPVRTTRSLQSPEAPAVNVLQVNMDNTINPAEKLPFEVSSKSSLAIPDQQTSSQLLDAYVKATLERTIDDLQCSSLLQNVVTLPSKGSQQSSACGSSTSVTSGSVNNARKSGSSQSIDSTRMKNEFIMPVLMKVANEIKLESGKTGYTNTNTDRTHENHGEASNDAGSLKINTSKQTLPGAKSNDEVSTNKQTNNANNDTLGITSNSNPPCNRSSLVSLTAICDNDKRFSCSLPVLASISPKSKEPKPPSGSPKMGVIKKTSPYASRVNLSRNNANQAMSKTTIESANSPKKTGSPSNSPKKDASADKTPKKSLSDNHKPKAKDQTDASRTRRIENKFGTKSEDWPSVVKSTYTSSVKDKKVVRDKSLERKRDQCVPSQKIGNQKPAVNADASKPRRKPANLLPKLDGTNAYNDGPVLPGRHLRMYSSPDISEGRNTVSDMFSDEIISNASGKHRSIESLKQINPASPSLATKSVPVFENQEKSPAKMISPVRNLYSPRESVELETRSSLPAVTSQKLLRSVAHEALYMIGLDKLAKTPTPILQAEIGRTIDQGPIEKVEGAHKTDETYQNRTFNDEVAQEVEEEIPCRLVRARTRYSNTKSKSNSHSDSKDFQQTLYNQPRGSQVSNIHTYCMEGGTKIPSRRFSDMTPRLSDAFRGSSQYVGKLRSSHQSLRTTDLSFKKNPSPPDGKC